MIKQLWILQSTPFFHEYRKHIEINCHFVEEVLVVDVVKTGYTPTIEQLPHISTEDLGVANLQVPI